MVARKEERFPSFSPRRTRFADRGFHVLKGLADEWRVFAVDNLHLDYVTKRY
ncbi:MAG: hypothetical protein JOZ23_12450 [Mycobacterium sp.]|nr:hypothetical protein [Mycobacterium sp.]MBV9352325.1 hypothetical protein [Mycobacterium sp.]